MTFIVILSGTSQTSPADWNNSNNTVEGIGGGGGGAEGTNGSGGGGGEYRKIANFNVATPGTTTFTYVIGQGGAGATTNAGNGGTGTNTTFSAVPNLRAVGGGGGLGAGGAGAGGTGGVGAAANFNGGAGGGTQTLQGGNGGGGAGGPLGVGGTGSSTTLSDGGGGGGNGGGGNGSNGSGTTGGAGGNNHAGSGSGAGGTGAGAGTNGTVGGGGGGGGGTSTVATTGGTGGPGTDFADGSHGSGGGGGGGGGNGGAGTTGGVGGNGGLYGGGGGAGGDGGSGGTASFGGAGANGILFITYAPASTTPVGFWGFDQPVILAQKKLTPQATLDFQSFVLPAQPTTRSQTGIGFFTPFDAPPKPRNYSRDWIEYSEFGYSTAATVVTFGGFTSFDPAPRPHNYSRDWIEYNEVGYKVTTLSQTGIAYFTPFWAKPPQAPNFARDWIEFYQQTTAVVTFGGFSPFYPPAKQVNFSRDWVAFTGNISVNAPQYTQPFSLFDPAPKPRNYARDWIEYSKFGYTTVITAVTFGGFSQFDPAPRPQNYARDWIDQTAFTNPIPFNQYYWPPTFTVPSAPFFFVNMVLFTPLTVPVTGFSPFDLAPRPHNYARDWIEYNEIGYTITTRSQTGIGFFTPFGPAQRPKNFAQDWIANFENTPAAAVVVTFGEFVPFDPAHPPRNLDVVRRDFQTFINAPGNPNQFFGNGHDWWPQSIRPRNFAKDWIEFYDRTTANPPATILYPFTNFDPPAKPTNFARDWVAFSGNVATEFPTFTQPFSPFGPAAKPINSAVKNFQEFINAPGNPNQFFGSGHDWWPRAPKPPFRAVDWTAYNPSNRFFTPTPTTSTMFMSFSDGMRAKLWSITGQQPQWWTDAFISPPSPPKPPSKRDTHDWIPKRRHKRAPPVYSQEYYDLLRKEQLEKLEQKQLQLPLLIPNLLIPLDGIIPPVDIPSLKIDIPSLRMPPPDRPVVADLPIAPAPVPAREPRNIETMVHQFSAAIDKFAEAALSISEAIASEIGHDQHEFEASRKVEIPVQAPAATPPRGVENVMQQFASAIDDLYKIGLSKNRVIYDTDGRIIGVEPIPDEENE